MVTMNISITKDLAEFVDKEVKEKKFANRSEFFRDIIRKIFFEKTRREIIEKDIDHYRMLDYSLKDAWDDPSNDNIFKY